MAKIIQHDEQNDRVSGSLRSKHETGNKEHQSVHGETESETDIMQTTIQLRQALRSISKYKNYVHKRLK